MKNKLGFSIGKGISLMFFVHFFTMISLQAKGVEVSAGEGLLVEARDLIDRRLFFEAEPKLNAAKSYFQAPEEAEAYLEAMFLLDQVYDMTVQQEKRERNVSDCRIFVDQNFETKSQEAVELHLLEVDNLLESARSEEAKTHLELLLPQLVSRKDFLNQSRSYQLLGRINQKQLKYSQAKESYMKALDLAVDSVPNNPRHVIKVLFSLVNFNIELSHLNTAKEYLDQLYSSIESLPVLESTDSLDQAKYFFLKGRREWRGGNYAKELECMEQAMLLYREISITHREHLGFAMSWVAGANLWLGRQELGTKAFEEMIYYLKNPTDKEMANTYHKGLLLYQFFKGFGKPHETEALLHTAYELEERWELNPYLGYNFASLHEISLGNHEEGLRFARMSLACFDSEGEWQVPCKPYRGNAHRAIGNAFLAMEVFDSAGIYFHRAMEDFSADFESDDWGDNPDENNSWSNKNVLDMANKKGYCFKTLAERRPDEREKYLRLAHSTFDHAARISWKCRMIYTSPQSKLSLAKRFKVTQQGAISTCFQLFEVTGDSSYLAQAFGMSEGAKGLLLLESQSKASARKRGVVPDELLQEGQYLKRELAYYQGALFKEKTYGEARDTNHIAWLKGNALSLQVKLDGWRDSILSEYPDYMMQSSPQAEISPDQVRTDLLDKGDALLEFFLGESEIYTFLVSRNKFEAHSTPLPDGFNSRVASFHRSIANLKFIQDSARTGFDRFTRIGNWLYELLLEPVLDEEDEFDQLILVPDKVLSQIPFEVLLTDSSHNQQLNYISLPYLIHQFEIHYAYSATSLLELKAGERDGEKVSCLAMAPGYNKSGLSRGAIATLRGSESNLIGAQKEVATLSQLGVEGEFLFGDSATEKRFKEIAPKHNLLHLAMHGQADTRESMRSNLRFTKVAWDTTEDHVLHSYELEAIPFDANLVVLSACESGIGEFVDGEGELTLGRDFLANGANSVVTTLWQVEDQASSQLMESFYEEMIGGAPTATALHNAKLKMLRNADSRSAHPYFWAGYVAIGDSRVLFKQGFSVWSRAAIGAAILGFLAIVLGGLRAAYRRWN